MKKFLVMIWIGTGVILFAQDEPERNQRSIGFGAKLGYFSAVDADAGSIMPGILMRAKFSDNVGVEVSFSYRKEEYGNGAVSVTSWPLTGSLLFYPINSVYGLAGLGYYNTSFDYPDNISSVNSEDKSEFGFHMGAGMEFPVATGIKIFGDIRYTIIGYDFQQLNGVDLETEANANFYEISLGGMFLF